MDAKQFKTLLKEDLAPIIKTQEKQLQKSDALIEEMDHVHKLADSTLDVVKGRYEKNKREIDEIKDHLNLPKKPYYGTHD